MAGYIEDRWINKKKDPVTGKRERSARFGKGTRYRVARIPGVRDMSFDTLEDAKAWLRRAGTDSERGEFVDPRDGSITVTDYVTRYWKAGVRGAPGTIKRVDERVRLHILPHLGSVALRDISATVLRGYIATLEGECAPRYARQILTSLSNIFETAIDDKRLVRNPMRAKSVRWPKVPEDLREIWPLETAQRVRDVINPRYRVAVVVALGCGLRQGRSSASHRWTSTSNAVSSACGVRCNCSTAACTSRCPRVGKRASSICLLRSQPSCSPISYSTRLLRSSCRGVVLSPSGRSRRSRSS